MKTTKVHNNQALTAPQANGLATGAVPNKRLMNRRQFVTGSAGLALAASTLSVSGCSSLANASATQRTNKTPEVLSGRVFNLDIGYQSVNFTGKNKVATAINGSVPAPTLRWKEGETVTIRVKNTLSVDSSIHWHGMILPTEMDGVPGLSFDGIKPGETFEYKFEINQSGTYWYHSHSGFQEQTGAYGSIVIEPKEDYPFEFDREHVVLLSDWSDEQPETIYAKLKKMSHYYNRRERTLFDVANDVKNKGIKQTWNARKMWNNMRMSDTDISDVTGYTYTFLMNGVPPENGWYAAFSAGEKVLLRFINAAAMTIFDVRIPHLKMTVVAADGQYIQPVSIDEFRIGVAETYDVIVEPEDNRAYTLFAQSIDRSGFTRGTLSSNPALVAEVPLMDHAPILGHKDMGMDMSGMAGMDHSGHDMSGMAGMSIMKDKNPESSHDTHNSHDKAMQMEAQTMQHAMPNKPLGKAGLGSNNDVIHAPSESGLQVDMKVSSPVSGLTDPGIGLRQHALLYGRKVLTYADIKSLHPTEDKRQPSREIQLHLTGNMSRYMWSINGIKFADAPPLELAYGERLRITLVNDTMMTHPIHLHGVWSELETGDPEYIPKKHTIIVQPGAKISYLVTADAKGRWAYHCHLLFHMSGMFREVRIS